MKKKSIDHLFDPNNKFDFEDDIYIENKKSFENERKGFSELDYEQKTETTRSIYDTLKLNLPPLPVINLDEFSKKFEKKKNSHQGHVNIPIPWKEVKNLLNKERTIRRGNQLISSQVESFISQLPFYQPIFPTFNSRNNSLFRNRLFDISNGILSSSGIFIKFFTVIKDENVIIASIDLTEEMVWCSIVFVFEKNILEQEEVANKKTQKSDNVLIFAEEDIDNDIDYAIYLSLNVSFIDYFFHLCPCFDDRKK